MQGVDHWKHGPYVNRLVIARARHLNACVVPHSL